jgi:hypothetical protein
MRRYVVCTCLFAGAALAQLPGQYPGGQYPGGQYPPGQTRGRLPGQGTGLPIPGRRPQGQQTPAPSTSRTSPNKSLATRDTSGILRTLSKNEIVVESTDHRVVWFRIGDTVKIDSEKFQPGDHLVVTSTEDDEGKYTAISVQWESKGTAEDRAAAAQTWDLPGDVALATDRPTEKPVNNNDERPRLTRKAPDAPSPTAAETKAPAESKAPEAKAPPAEIVQAQPEDKPLPPEAADTADERPKLVRGKPSATPPAQTAQRDDSKPKLIRPVPSDPPPAPAASDDRPKLVRAQAAEAPQPKTEAVPAPRPQPEAEAVPAYIHVRTGPMPTHPDDAVIAKAREAAANFLESLPRFAVKQNTTRYVQEQARGQWQAQDVVTANLAFKDGSENYTDIKVNNKPSNKAETTGLHTTGEFGTIMNNLFDPDTGANFTKATQVQIRGHKAWRYAFSVIRTRSDFRVETPSQLFYTPYEGTVWIDADTFRLLRIEMQATELPKAFPFDTVEMNIDYDYIRLEGSAQFLLPTETEALNCIRGTPVCMKNTTSFRNYVKFDAKSDIIFDTPQ